jgi:hypothetical protein
MAEIIGNKKYNLKICNILYRNFIHNNQFRVEDLYRNRRTYEIIFQYINESLSHNDWDVSDYLYACFYENVDIWGSRILMISPEQLILPEIKPFKGKRTYYAEVRFEEYYSMETYMPIMLENVIEQYQIDEDTVETDILDTWDHEVDIEIGD